MSAILFVITFALGQAQPEKPVTEAEKKAFLELVAQLSTKGEFFTDEAVAKAIPHTRVLLALTEKDLKKLDLYAFLALSSGLMEHKEPRQYAIHHFATIAHPTLKLAWGAMLLRNGESPREIVIFLRKALDSNKDAQTLAEMAGPTFEELRARVIRVYEQGRKFGVQLVKHHSIPALPEYGGGFNYTSASCVFAPGPLLYAVRPFQQRGELITYNVAKGTTERRAIPQPKGFRSELGFLRYFDDPALFLDSSGDLLCLWTIKGNGDHGLALLRKGADSFRVERIRAYLGNCSVVAKPGGDWFIVQGAPRFTVSRVDQELKLMPLGKFAGEEHHTFDILDAHFIAKDVLHLFWADVLSEDNHLRMRCIDFDVTKQKWLHNREVFRLDKFVSVASGPTVFQLGDGSLHYLWPIDEGSPPGDATGLYYQAESDGKTIKVAKSHEYRATVVGNRMVVCYTLKESPDKIFFRVINHGSLSSPSEITIGKGPEYGLKSNDMILFAESDRIWLMCPSMSNTLYELKLEEAKK